MSELKIQEEIRSRRKPVTQERMGFAKSLRLAENGRTETLRRTREQLERESRTDRVTGLPNDMQFYEMLGGMEAAYGRDREFGQIDQGVFVIADLTGLHRTNDNISYEAGDRYLVDVAKSLGIRQGDRVFRMGKTADELVLHLKDIMSAGQIHSVLDRVDHELKNRELVARGKYPNIEYGLSYSIAGYGVNLSPGQAYEAARNKLGKAKQSKNGERVGGVGRLFVNEFK